MNKLIKHKWEILIGIALLMTLLSYLNIFPNIPNTLNSNIDDNGIVNIFNHDINEDKIPNNQNLNNNLFNNIPTFNLPLRYFTDNSVIYGTINSVSSLDNIDTWEYATIGGKDAYQSFPTETITLNSDDFSNDIKELPPIKSEAQMDRFLGGKGDSPLRSFYENQKNEYGNLVNRFLPLMKSISSIKTFDVDNDKKDEKIISLCGVWGNHCPHEIIIVKNRKIIFSSNAGLGYKSIKKSDTNNGFYINWIPAKDKWDKGLCCPLGHMKTRFVYKNGKFKPIYEQKVLYFNVKNTE